MANMFSGALSFNKPLDHFHVENVEDFTEMFFGADAFNQDISNWDMQSAKYMSHMFGDELAYSTKFRKDLCAWGRRFDTTDWDVSYMFENANCPDAWDPDLSATPKGPFCYTCRAGAKDPCIPRAASGIKQVINCGNLLHGRCSSCYDVLGTFSSCLTSTLKDCCMLGYGRSGFVRSVHQFYKG